MTMNWCVKLLVIGFLLWDQNNITSGQNASDPKNDQSESDPQAPNITVSVETPTLANTSTAVFTAFTPPFTSRHSNSANGPHITQTLLPDSTISSRKHLKPANTSYAVPTPFTANSTIIQYLPTDVPNTTAMQAPTATTIKDLTSAFTRITGSFSSDFHQPTSSESTPAMTVFPSSPGGEPRRYCSEIKILPPSYQNKNDTLIVENLYNYSISCENISSRSADYTFSLNNSVFMVSRCEPKTTTCFVEKCGYINLTLDAPPDEKWYSLDPTTEKWNASFNWKKIGQQDCIVTVKTVCTDKVRNITFSGERTVNLEPYSNYSCISNISYRGEVFNSSNVNITTKIAEPGKVQNGKCQEENTTITCKWDKPNIPNGPLNSYEINRDDESFKSIKKLSYKFENLEPYTEYKIKVKACNKDEKDLLCGDYVESIIKTKEGVPGVVTQLKAYVSSKHNNEIIIRCNLPKKPNGGSGKYEVFLDDNRKKIWENTSCYFTISNLNYLTTYKYTIYYRNSVFPGKETTQNVTTNYNDKALIGFLAFLITITSLALIFVLLKIYKLKKKSSSNNEDSIPLTNPDDEKQLLNIEPILVEQLLETYKRKSADEGRLFLDEFQSIPRVFSKFPIKEARKPCNQTKNRYIDILPYDDNRVVLSEIHGEPGSDYINASYINGFKEPRKYIAAQGPKEETMNDFWRMIWEQKSTIIVMVTRCEEGNRNKCAQYWPLGDGNIEEYGDIVVKITEQKLFPDYITRKLHVSHKREKTERDITHIQFTIWPDHGVPDDPNLLLKLRRRVNALSNFFSGPIIVHCSAGVGRTGTYISIDAMLEGLETEGRVDVYGYVVQLRRQRCLMVQVESQYMFIHKALVEYNQFGETEVSLSELPLILNNLKKKDPPSEPSQLMCEFQRLPSYRNWRPQTTGNHQDNKDKNRSSVVPYEFNRVLIRTDEEPEQEVTEDSEMSSDDESDSEETIYINASYIIGYWGTRENIAAQSPLKNTLPEFWQMIYQKKVKAIVMLSESNQENNENSCVPYWQGQSKTYDDLQVELTSETLCGSYTERCFEIRHAKRKDVRKVSQYHYKQWEDAIPTETKELVNMINKIKMNIPTKRKDEQTKHDKSVPLVVHCSDGSQLTGTFSALWNLLDSARVEGVIDVFQTVKNLRRQRSGIVSTFDQYQFLYDALANTVPAQNGQVKSVTKPKDKLEIQNEFESQIPGYKVDPTSTADPGEETSSKPKDNDTNANGPSPAAFTDVSLRIDE
ncbi:receptor-type tyrosine-protein phosphatase C isoform X3 [Pyxicephalus adspersus]|uniref:receptor-type tyrosine-protein phosphatase C isoform X3 n=1 Tax=Pyxicephalus adspersus TaxID=30357 RepID=UPI003B5B1630